MEARNLIAKFLQQVNPKSTLPPHTCHHCNSISIGLREQVLWRLPLTLSKAAIAASDGCKLFQFYFNESGVSYDRHAAWLSERIAFRSMVIYPWFHLQKAPFDSTKASNLSSGVTQGGAPLSFHRGDIFSVYLDVEDTHFPFRPCKFDVSASPSELSHKG